MTGIVIILIMMLTTIFSGGMITYTVFTLKARLLSLQDSFSHIDTRIYFTTISEREGYSFKYKWANYFVFIFYSLSSSMFSYLLGSRLLEISEQETHLVIIAFIIVLSGSLIFSMFNILSLQFIYTQMYTNIQVLADSLQVILNLD